SGFSEPTPRVCPLRERAAGKRVLGQGGRHDRVGESEAAVIGRPPLSLVAFVESTLRFIVAGQGQGGLAAPQSGAARGTRIVNRNPPRGPRLRPWSPAPTRS